MYITYLNKTVRLQNIVYIEQNPNFYQDIIVDNTILLYGVAYDTCQLKYKQILTSIKNGDKFCDIN